LVYLFILNSRMDYYWLRASLTANLFTSALSIIYLSQMSVIEQLSPIQQLFFSKASEVLFYFNFIIIPLAIVLVATIGTHIKKA
ncbi:MAG: hypothetical protein KKE05_05730, partial [Nanoarchaeota archaeon]|nr:hypothetical protein [Nanoarchaeota archaeon]